MGLAIRLTPEEPIGTNRPAGSLPGKSGDILEVGVAPPPFCLPLSVLLDFTMDCHSHESVRLRIFELETCWPARTRRP